MNNLSSYVPHAHVSNAIATLVLAAVGVWGVCETGKSLELSERAWISSVGATLAASQRGDITIHIQNSTIDSYDPTLTDVNSVQTSENTACAGIKTVEGRDVTPPTGPSVGYVGINVSSAYGEPPLYLDDRINNGDKFYVLNGCAAYTTYEKTRHTAFCYILVSTFVNARREWHFDTCGRGFPAD